MLNRVVRSRWSDGNQRKGTDMDERDRIRWADEPVIDDADDDEFLAALLAHSRDDFAELRELNEVA
jgi:hypothetical protein